MGTRAVIVVFTFMLSLQLTLAQLLPIVRQLATPSAQTDANVRASPIEIEVFLLRFVNPHGIVYSGKKCDFFAWGCDIQAYGYIDSVKPYAEFPGSRDIQGPDFFWYRGEESSPRFNHLFRKTICDPKQFKAGNLRVHLKDIDGGLRGNDDFINNFNCIFTKNSVIAANETVAKWSDELACDAVFHNVLMGLFFQYRIYQNPSSSSCSKV